ncbi:MAG: TRAP transporter large permease [Paracoccus sp. (in: a-proteobacteria)]|nr:TRAP transporter large permease [Paracoccus sp. (in: a-proteobacteria)]
MAGISFVGMVILSVPIAFVLALSAVIYILASGNTMLLMSYPLQLFGGLENYGLLSLPLFILLGEFMNAGGIGRRLMALALAVLGSVRGGLAYVNLGANMMMAAILGSTVAQITIMSRLAVPEMEKQGYPRDISVAITAAGGMLAPIIPPSMMFIIYGVIAQLPIGDLFIAGILPGALIFLAFLAVIGWLARTHDFPRNQRMSLPARGRAVLDALPAALIPATIIGTILGGIAHPTESAALGCIATILIGAFIYRELTWPDILRAFVSAARASAVVLFLIATATVFSWVITFENIPARVAAAMQAMTTSPLVFMLMLNLLLLLVGMVTDPIPAIILVVPVLLPVATGVYGIDPVFFGVVLCVNLTLGLLTPPVGTGLFTAALMGGVRAERLAVLLLPFFLAVLAVILLMVLLPDMVLYLPAVL